MDKHRDSLANRFTRGDRQRLKRGLERAKGARQYRRLEAVLAVAEGESIQQAAGRVHRNRSSVHRWVRRYWRSRTIQALVDRPRCGRPRAAPQLSVRRLTRLLETNPGDCGYQTPGWTVALLGAHLRRQGIRLSAYTLRSRIREARFRWKRPRYVYSKRADHVGAKKGGLSEG
jgi:transposase